MYTLRLSSGYCSDKHDSRAMNDNSGERSLFAFLFTDIEGSTRLWEQFPEAMARALMRHDETLRDAVRAHGGQVYRSAGDAVQAYFPIA